MAVQHVYNGEDLFVCLLRVQQVHCLFIYIRSSHPLWRDRSGISPSQTWVATVVYGVAPHCGSTFYSTLSASVKLT